jgi:hypothetical protein
LVLVKIEVSSSVSVSKSLLVSVELNKSNNPPLVNDYTYIPYTE